MQRSKAPVQHWRLRRLPRRGWRPHGVLPDLWLLWGPPGCVDTNGRPAERDQPAKRLAEPVDTRNERRAFREAKVNAGTRRGAWEQTIVLDPQSGNVGSAVIGPIWVAA